MSTLAALKAQIADNLNRGDLTTQIAALIPRAIEFYADQRFWFNEDRKTVTTTIGNEYVTIPSGLREEDSVLVTIGGSRYRLTKRSSMYIEDLHAATNTEGQPSDYAWIGTQFRLWPTPNDTYTITVLGIYDIAYPDSDSGSNAWTDAARELIAGQVEFYLARDTLRDPERMQMAANAVDLALSKLIGKTGKRTGTGRMRSYM